MGRNGDEVERPHLTRRPSDGHPIRSTSLGPTLDLRPYPARSWYASVMTGHCLAAVRPTKGILM